MKCRYCNSQAITIADKNSPIVRVPHVRNWGAENLVYSFSMCYSKRIQLDVCHYHYKTKKHKRVVDTKLRKLRRSR